MKEGQLRVWHIPQVPGKPFRVEVNTIHEAMIVLKVLANYDIFQFENKIKPDYCNAAGLEVYRNGEWEEWSSEEGDCIDDVMYAVETTTAPNEQTASAEPTNVKGHSVE